MAGLHVSLLCICVSHLINEGEKTSSVRKEGEGEEEVRGRGGRIR